MYMSKLAKYIDHTLLKPISTYDEIIDLCEEAKEYKFASVCIPPCFAYLAHNKLKGWDVNVSTVIGFPFGYSSTYTKIKEIRDAKLNGVKEVDIVINIGLIKSELLYYVSKELGKLMGVARHEKLITKIIIETCYLTREEKIAVCKLVNSARPDYIKTSTGFGIAGATVEDVLLLKTYAPDVKVKAAGGIKSLDHVMAMIHNGASRIGTSSGVAIMKDYISRIK